MFLGLGQGRDRDQNFGTCWEFLQVGFKFYFILEMILSLLTLFLGGYFMYFPNIVKYTVQNLQLWRVFTSFLLPAVGSFGIINVLFDFYMLYMCMPDVEKKYSTAYILLEVFMQITLINLVMVVIGYPFIYFGVLSDLSLVSYGMQPVLYYFIWCKVAQNPDQPTRFCFFPCLIPMKYIPLCLVFLFMVFGSPPIPLIIYCFLGYYQTMVRKSSVFKLPLSVYRKVDSLMPASVKQKPGYTKVTSVEANLRSVCSSKGCCEWGNGQAEANPFRNEQPNIYQSSSNTGNRDRVQIMGGGVSIGGNNYVNPQNQANFKNYWRQRDQEEVIQQERNNLRNAVQERQDLDSDQRFAETQKELSSAILKKKSCDTEIDSKSELSAMGLRTERDQEQLDKK